MPLAPDGTWRRPTDAETDLTQDVIAAISRAQADPGDAHPEDPVHLAIAAVQAVIDARWTPPTNGDRPCDRCPGTATTTVRCAYGCEHHQCQPCADQTTADATTTETDPR